MTRPCLKALWDIGLCVFFIAFTVLNGVAAEKQIVIKFAHNDSATVETVKHAGALAMKYIMEKESAGNLKMEIYPAGQLGGEKENVEGTISGTIQMSANSDGALASFVPDVMAMGLPYYIKSPTVVWDVLENSEYGKDIRDLMMKRLGLRVIGYGDIGFRNFTNNKRPILTPQDMKGVKFRTMQNPAHIKMIEALGGIAVPMDFTELYTALQVGTLDGQENPVVVINYARLYEVQKYLTMDGHIFTPLWLVINEKFYQSLTPDLQAVVRRAGVVGTNVMRATVQLLDGVRLDKLIESGMKVNFLTPEQLGAFRNAASNPVRAFIVSKIGEGMVNKFEKGVKAADAKYGIK
jgi:TRAP-type transport system periplasmic protein